MFVWRNKALSLCVSVARVFSNKKHKQMQRQAVIKLNLSFFHSLVVEKRGGSTGVHSLTILHLLDIGRKEKELRAT